MKRFKKIFALITVVACLVSSLSVSAAVVGVNETNDSDLGEFRVLEYSVIANSITITGKAPLDEVSLVSFHIQEDNTENDLVYWQTETDETGVFSVKFTLKADRYDENGENSATIRVGGLGINTQLIEGVELYSMDEMEGCKTAFTAIGGADAFEQFFDDYSQMLGIEGAYTEEEIEILYSYYEPEDSDELQAIISKISELVDKLSRHKALVSAVSDAAISGDGQEIRRLLHHTMYADIVDFSLDTSLILHEADMWARMCNEEGYTTLEEIENAFNAAHEAQFAVDKEMGGVVTDDRLYNFNNEWKIRSVANLVTVKGSHENEKKTDLMIHIAGVDSGATTESADTIMMLQTETNSKGEFELVFPMNTKRFDADTISMLRISAPKTNIVQFYVPLYAQETVDFMIEEFKNLDSVDELSEFIGEYGKMLELGSGFSQSKLEIMYELYTEKDYSAIDDANAVVAEIVSLNENIVKVQDFLDELNAANRWGKVQSIIKTTYKESLKEVSAHYAELLASVGEYEDDLRDAYIKAMYGALIGKSYKNIQTIIDDLDAEFEVQKDKQTDADKQTSKPSGGGGGSFGGGGGKTENLGFGEDFIVEDMTDEVVLEPEKLPVAPFNDLSGYDWAKTAIDGLRKVGVVSGDGNGTYRPASEMTREEYLAVLLRTFGVEINEGNAPFSDVEADGWYKNTVATAYSLGVTKGMGDGTFGIGKNITRADMVVMAARLADTLGVKYNQVEEARIFEDYSLIPDYAYEAIVTFQQANFINGDDKSCFNPQNNTTRAEAAVFFWAIYDFIN